MSCPHRWTFALLATLVASPGFAQELQPARGPLPAQAPILLEKLKVEPKRMEFGELHRGETRIQSVTVTNITDEPVRIFRSFSTCGCTVPVVPGDPIAPGESVSFDVQFTGKNTGPASSVVRLFLAEGKGEVYFIATAQVRRPIVVEPALFEADPQDDIRITLTSTDGSAFQIMVADPGVIDGIDEMSRVVHTLTISAEKLRQAGDRRHHIRIYTDHDRIDSVVLKSNKAQMSRETKQLHAWAKGAGDLVDLARYVEEGADVLEADERGVDPLMLASIGGRVDRVKALLDFGANINARSRDGRTALMCAGQVNGNVETMRMLLQAGASVNEADRFDRAALYWAARSGDPERIRLLVEYGAEVNMRGPSGESPLIAAVKSGKMKAVRTLVEAGANPVQADNRRRRPIDHAMIVQAYSKEEDKPKLVEIVEYLKSVSG